jgi:hypothetical protein
VARFGTNVNQAVTVLHATGEVPEWMERAAALVGRSIRALDELGQQQHVARESATIIWIRRSRGSSATSSSPMDSSSEVVREALERGEDEVVPAREVVRHRSEGHVGGVGDGAIRRAARALLLDDVQRHVQDAIASLRFGSALIRNHEGKRNQPPRWQQRAGRAACLR